jgi:hypothetical protein
MAAKRQVKHTEPTTFSSNEQRGGGGRWLTSVPLCKEQFAALSDAYNLPAHLQTGTTLTGATNFLS